jgi:hypothetical protein
MHIRRLDTIEKKTAANERRSTQMKKNGSEQESDRRLLLWAASAFGLRFASRHQRTRLMALVNRPVGF